MAFIVKKQANLNLKNNTTFKIPRTPFLPSSLGGLSLWLKADAGVTTNTVGGVNSTTGKVGNCASFDGVEGGGSYNSRLYTNSFGVAINSNFSLSVWIKPRSFSSFQHIIGAPFQNGFYIGADETDLTFNLFNGTVWGITAPTVTPDTWNHYVFIRDGDTLKLYANNTFIGDVSVAGESFTGDPIFSVGGGEFDEYYFNGDIDEMALYSRAITVPEISTLYNSGNGTNYAGSPSSNMVSYWSLNESSGIRYDSHGSNNLSENPASTTGVTAWADQSGNTNNASPVDAPPVFNASDLNGKPTISLTSMDDYIERVFSISINPLGVAGSTAFSVQYVEDVCGAFDDNGPIFGNFGGSEDSFGTYQSHYPYGPDCLVYDAFGTRLRKNEITPPVTITNAWTLYSVKSTNNDWQSFVNGQLMHSDPTNTYSSAIGGDGALYIGKQTAAGTFKLKGKVAEVIVYNRVLTTQERQQVEAYLNSKYQIY